VSQSLTSFSSSPAPEFGHRRSYSYDGADLICAGLLREVVMGCYIDAGANHPTHNNNTFYFRERGWTGLAIEGNSDFAPAWEQDRPDDIFVNSLISKDNKTVEFLKYSDHTLSTIDPISAERYTGRFNSDHVSKEIRQTETLFDLKNQYLNDREIHLLSVDVEGEDLNCLIGAKLDIWQPGLVVVETKHLSLYDIRHNEIVSYLSGHGFRLIAKTPLDAFFIYPDKPYLNWIPKSLIQV
jgi:hypothetical protein